MRMSVLALVLVAVAPAASLGQTLQDQITAVYQAQQEQEARQRTAYAAQQAAIRRAHEEELAVQKARLAQAAARQREQAVEVAADKKRDQSYEDKLRELNIQRQELELQAQKTVGSRENDYINSDLARRAAETDVIRSGAEKLRSQADANRNVSSGVKDYLDQSGAAAVKKAESGTFREE
jgi:Family of unknown function (DUF5384)